MIVADSVLDVSTPSGTMRTSLYQPVGFQRPIPGLLLYSEIFQQTAPIQRLAVTFASQGFRVMVPEVYHSRLPAGCVLGYDDAGKEMGNRLKKEIPLGVFDGDITAAIDALAALPDASGRIGAVGVCLGGHFAFRAALDPRIHASACFFPTDLHTGTLGREQKADTLARARDIRGELMMVWGRQDPHIPADGRRAIYEALHGAATRFTWHEFNAEHAFLRDEGPRHDPAVAQLCRALAFDLFHRNL